MKPLIPRLRHPCAALALCGACALFPAQAAPAGAAFTVLHSVLLPAREVNGIRMQELSGLAFDADEQMLYAVSDRGHVFHLQLKVSATRIESLVPMLAASLRDPRDEGRTFNAEGLAVVNAGNGVKGDTELVVAIENGPAVVRFTPRGVAIADVPLPLALRDGKSYRSKNKRLEAIAAHPEHGLVMAPEVSLQSQPESRHTLYATSGGSWSFETLADGSDLKAIETLADGALLVLERVGGGRKRKAGLRRIDPTSCGADRVCATGDAPVGELTLAEGNFEGMTHVSGALYLLVSDTTQREGAASFMLIRVHAP